MDSRRRDFLRRAGLALPLVTLAGVFPPEGRHPARLASPSEFPERPKDAATAELYRGYAIFWTGWKSGMHDADFRGQWLAWPHPPNGKDGWKLYGEKAYIATAVPYGLTGFYRRGDQFNMAVQWSRVPPDTPGVITFDAAEEERRVAIAEGKCQLLDFIEREGYRG